LRKSRGKASELNAVREKSSKKRGKKVAGKEK